MLEQLLFLRKRAAPASKYLKLLYLAQTWVLFSAKGVRIFLSVWRIFWQPSHGLNGNVGVAVVRSRVSEGGCLPFFKPEKSSHNCAVQLVLDKFFFSCILV